MKIDKTIIEGVYIINNFNVHDDRGLFVKTFNNNGFKSNDINFEIGSLISEKIVLMS